MRQVAINWISATLVITSWCNVYCNLEDPSSRNRIYSALHSENNVEHIIKSTSSPLHSDEISKRNSNEKLKDELLSLGSDFYNLAGKESLKTQGANDE